MEEEKTLPVLTRLDRLDHLVQMLEEKQNLSRRRSSKPVSSEMEQQEDHCKTLYSALEEVHHKGTLIERLAALENRVLQLSMEMDDSNTSRSSSSTAQISENIGHNSVVPNVSRRDKDETPVNQETEYHPPSIQEDATVEEECKLESKGRKGGRENKRTGYRKWKGLFRMGCN